MLERSLVAHIRQMFCRSCTVIILNKLLFLFDVLFKGTCFTPPPSSLGWGNRWVDAMADDRRMVIALLVKYLRGGML